MYSQSTNKLAININSLSFDSFDRDPNRDIVCVAPVRTIVRREEEILLIRRVRKVEDIDAGPACPIGQQVAVGNEMEKKTTEEPAYQHQ